MAGPPWSSLRDFDELDHGEIFAATRDVNV
jgi:hypothetical protein